MKSAIIFSVAASVLALAASPAFAKDPEVRIKDAVARVAVIVEDRADVAVEIERGRSSLPALEVRRIGDRVEIDGQLNGRSRINNCRSGDNPRQAGDGASVEVRGVGRVALSDAPLIVIRSPRDVNVSAGSAVFGSIGRGASSVDLTSGGCGDWDVANTDGPVEITIGGSGDVRMGSSRSLDATLGGAGSLSTGATGNLDLTIGGSGEARIAGVNGPVDVTIGGAGEVDILRGNAPSFDVTIGGSGDVDFGGTAGDVSVTIAGSGDVSVARATGRISRTVMGSGDLNIGR